MIKFKSFLLEKKVKMKTLYVCRDLLNDGDLMRWAKKVGFKQTLKSGDFHITCAYSKKKVDWNDIHLDTADHHVFLTKDDYDIERFDGGAVVLKFKDEYLKNRWKYFKKHGASWDYEDYKPHVTITYDGEDMDLDNIHKIAEMPLIFSSERRQEIVEDWADKIKEE